MRTTIGTTTTTMRQPHPLLPDRQLFSISQVNHLPDEERLQVYRHLVPFEVLLRFGIDPETLADQDGHLLFECLPGDSSVESTIPPQNGSTLIACPTAHRRISVRWRGTWMRR
jgi:hypothetical protein